MEPAPPHDGHVVAIWKPLWMTKVRVPVPLHVAQVLFLAPGLRPEPVQVPQRSMGLMTTLRLVPLHASSNVRLMVVSRSSPRASPAKPAPPKPGPR